MSIFILKPEKLLKTFNRHTVCCMWQTLMFGNIFHYIQLAEWILDMRTEGLVLMLPQKMSLVRLSLRLKVRQSDIKTVRRLSLFSLIQTGALIILSSGKSGLQLIFVSVHKTEITSHWKEADSFLSHRTLASRQPFVHLPLCLPVPLSVWADLLKGSNM